MLDGSIAGGAANVRRLCDVEPPPPAARVFHREPRDQARRRGSASRRIGRGEDLAVRALRPVDLVLSVLAGRLSGRGRRLARAFRRQAGGERARSGSAHARSAAMGVAARIAQRPRRPGSSPRTTPARTALKSRSVERRAGIVRVAAAVLLRGDGAGAARAASRGKPYAGYWEFPGGKLEAGEVAAPRADRELREELGIDVERAAPWLMQEFVYPHAHVELQLLSRVRVGRRTRRATTARRSSGSRPAATPSRRCCPRTRASSRRSTCRSSTASPAPTTSARRHFWRAPSARSKAAFASCSCATRTWPLARVARARAALVAARASLRRARAVERHRRRSARSIGATACIGLRRC